MKLSKHSSVSVNWDKVFSVSFTDIDPELIPFLIFSKIRIIVSEFAEIRALNGSSTKVDKIRVWSLSSAEPYAYLPRGREIFVNWVSISDFILDFWW